MCPPCVPHGWTESLISEPLNFLFNTAEYSMLQIIPMQICDYVDEYVIQLQI